MTFYFRILILIVSLFCITKIANCDQEVIKIEAKANVTKEKASYPLNDGVPVYPQVLISANILNTSNIDQSLGTEFCGHSLLDGAVTDNEAVYFQGEPCTANLYRTHKIVLKPGETFQGVGYLSFLNMKVKVGLLKFRIGIMPEGHATIWSNEITMEVVKS